MEPVVELNKDIPLSKEIPWYGGKLQSFYRLSSIITLPHDNYLPDNRQYVMRLKYSIVWRFEDIVETLYVGESSKLVRNLRMQFDGKPAWWRKNPPEADQSYFGERWGSGGKIEFHEYGKRPYVWSRPAEYVFVGFVKHDTIQEAK